MHHAQHLRSVCLQSMLEGFALVPLRAAHALWAELHLRFTMWRDGAPVSEAEWCVGPSTVYILPAHAHCQEFGWSFLPIVPQIVADTDFVLHVKQVVLTKQQIDELFPPARTVVKAMNDISWCLVLPFPSALLVAACVAYTLVPKLGGLPAVLAAAAPAAAANGRAAIIQSAWNLLGT